MVDEWWRSLLSKWSWDDPMLLLGFASFVVTTIISIVLWKMGAKQAKRDSEQAKRDSELQAKILENQTLISQRQRRDALPEIIERASYPTHLEMLWKEVSGYKRKRTRISFSLFFAPILLFRFLERPPVRKCKIT